jgi:2-polyprenyl-6-hydroxyphenyl methylase/3-demethylubiquinone-9 3-methyltransferase
MNRITVMSQVAGSEVGGGQVPDFGWRDTKRTCAHSYIEPLALHLIDDCVRRQRSPRRARVFDAGCGNGALLQALSSRDYELAGCDASESGVQRVRERMIGRANVGRHSLYDDLAATYGDTWDVVIATEVIEHLYSPRQFLGRVRSLLRPGGALILSTPYHGYLKNLALAVAGHMDQHFTALWDGGHIKFWSRATLSSVLDELEFRDLEFRGAGRLPWLWKSMFVVGFR